MENNKLIILKHKRKCKGPKMVKTVLEKNIVKDSGNSIKLQVSNTVWYWHKDRPREQWNKTENPELKPHRGEWINKLR